jgi:hypothetical protein
MGRTDRHKGAGALATALLLTLAGCSAANAEQSWTCTYPGYLADRAPVIVRYREIDGFLVEEEFGTKYRILQDNRHAVIATWTFAEIERGNSAPSIAAATIMIVKATGDFLRSNARPDSDSSRARGKCLKG